MKIRIISHREEIVDMNANEKIVHLAFRPSNKDIYNVIEACPKIEALQLPPSYRKTLAESVEMLLKMQGVAIIEGDVWGHRRDLLEYKVIPAGAFEKINRMREEGKALDQVVHAVAGEFNISQQVVKYIIQKNITA